RWSRLSRGRLGRREYDLHTAVLLSTDFCCIAGYRLRIAIADRRQFHRVDPALLVQVAEDSPSSSLRQVPICVVERLERRPDFHIVRMALDSNPLIAGSGLEIRNQFIEDLIALGLDGCFARFKPNLLHQLTETNSGFSRSILYLKLGWRRSRRRHS